MSADTPIYRCKPRKATGRCKAPAIINRRRVEEAAERAVIQHLRSLTFSATERTGAVDRAKADLADTDEELRLYQEITKASEVGAEHFAAGLERRVADVEAKRKALAKAQLAAPSAPRTGTLGEEWDSMNPDERRQVLCGALGAVWVWKGRNPRFRLVAAGFEPSEVGPPTGSTSTCQAKSGCLARRTARRPRLPPLRSALTASGELGINSRRFGHRTPTHDTAELIVFVASRQSVASTWPHLLTQHLGQWILEPDPPMLSLPARRSTVLRPSTDHLASA